MYFTPLYSALYYIALFSQHFAINCANTGNDTTLHYTTLHYTTINYTTILHNITLDYTTLHALDYIMIH